METKQFDPKNEDDCKIVQKRIDIMMKSKLMRKWINQNLQFGKDEKFTNEVLKYLIDCAITYHNESDFFTNIKPNSKKWILNLELKISSCIKKN